MPVCEDLYSHIGFAVKVVKNADLGGFGDEYVYRYGDEYADFYCQQYQYPDLGGYGHEYADAYRDQYSNQ